MNFYLAQFFGLMCLVTYVISNRYNERKKVLWFRSLTNAFSGVQYILLGSMAGFGVEIVGILRNYVIQKYKRESLPFYLIFIFIMLEALVCVIFYDGISSVLVCLTGAMTTFFISRKDLTSLRFHQAAVIIPISLIFNVMVEAWGGALTNVVQIFSVVSGMKKFDQKKVKRIARNERRHFKRIRKNWQKRRENLAKTKNRSSKKS